MNYYSKNKILKDMGFDTDSFFNGDNSMAGSLVKEMGESTGYNYNAMIRTMFNEVKDDPALLAAILKNKDLYRWWQADKEKQEIERIRQEALDKLSDREKEVLGIWLGKSL